MKIKIIGKNSFLAKKFIQFCDFKKIEINDSFSHNQINNIVFDNEDLYIIFSLSKKSAENISLLNFICEKNSKFLVIGSVSAISKRANYFLYSRLKKDQLQFINMKKKNNIMYGTFGSFSTINKNGIFYQSTFDHILDAINDLQSGFSGSKVYATLIKNNEHIVLAKIYYVLEILIKVRATALLYRTFTNSIYGYSRIDNE